MDTQRLSPLKKREIIGGFAYLPMYLLGTQVLISVVFGLMGKDLEAEQTLLQLNFWNGLINLAAVLLIFHSFLWGQLRRFRGGFFRNLLTIGIGYVIILGGNVLVNVVQTILDTMGHGSTNFNQEAAQSMVTGNPLVMLPMVVVFAPIVEETFFRGLIFGLIHRKSRVLAYLASILIFAFLHVYEPLLMGQPLTEALVSLLSYLPIGFAACWVFERCRSLWGAIVLHALSNGIAFAGILLLGQAGISM